MSETVNFIQGSKKNYDSSTMQGGVYFSKDSKEILLNGESYGNAVPADEEDITAASGSLKLKDREVDAANFQSKGYVILRKNIVDGKNVLTQEMINEPNTIYEIRYDFDLNGATITIPNNCTLKFEGGVLSNGNIKGTDSNIISNTTKIFETNISLLGSWKNECFLVNWYNLNNDGITDDTQGLIKVLQAPFNTFILVGEYYITDTILTTITKNLTIQGPSVENMMNANGRHDTCIIFDQPNSEKGVFQILNSNNRVLSLKGIHFKILNEGSAIYCTNNKINRFIVKDIDILYTRLYSFKRNSDNTISIEGNTSCGFYITCCFESSFANITCFGPKYCFYIHSNSDNHNAWVDDIYFEHVRAQGGYCFYSDSNNLGAITLNGLEAESYGHSVLYVKGGSYNITGSHFEDSGTNNNSGKLELSDITLVSQTVENDKLQLTFSSDLSSYIVPGSIISIGDETYRKFMIAEKVSGKMIETNLTELNYPFIGKPLICHDLITIIATRGNINIDSIQSASHNIILGVIFNEAVIHYNPCNGSGNNCIPIIYEYSGSYSMTHSYTVPMKAHYYNTGVSVYNAIDTEQVKGFNKFLTSPISIQGNKMGFCYLQYILGNNEYIPVMLYYNAVYASDSQISEKYLSELDNSVKVQITLCSPIEQDIELAVHNDSSSGSYPKVEKYVNLHLLKGIHTYQFEHTFVDFPKSRVCIFPKKTTNVGIAEIVWNFISNNFKSGSSETRPSCVEEGFTYFDTTLNQKVLWNGLEWVNVDGTSLEKWTTIE